jgi:hypothetical protein
MSPRLRRLGLYLWAVAVLGALGGCATTRNLKISEVSLNAIELYLDEDRANRLDLDGQKLGYMNSSGDSAELDLFGTIPGGGWLVIWEGPATYTAPPASQDYVNFFGRNVPGIVVSPSLGLFKTPTSETFAYRVSGRGTRYIFPFFLFYDDVDDVVKFGGGPMNAPRPNIGGRFTETQALGAAKARQPSPGGATAAKTISRKWDAGSMRPIDTDSEDDWSREDDNLGRATP